MAKSGRKKNRITTFEEGDVILVDDQEWELVNYLPKHKGFEVLPAHKDSTKYYFFATLYLQQWAAIKVNGEWEASKTILCKVCSKQQDTQVWHLAPCCRKQSTKVKMEPEESYDMETN